MTFDRQSLKRKAKRRIGENGIKVLLAGASYVLIAFILSAIILRVTGYTEYLTEFMDVYMETAEEMMTAMESGDVLNEESFMQDLLEVEPPRVSNAAWILAAALYVLMTAFEAGFSGYCLHVSRENKPSYRMLFSSFTVFTKVFFINLIRWIAIISGCILFVFPGVFAAYRFRMAIFIMYDNPELGALACLRRSSQLMRGNCLDLFAMDLSFIGWYWASQLVMAVGLPILDMWLQPYKMITTANYYNAMMGYRKEPEPTEENI